MRIDFLGGLTARTFLRRHWQKRPLLVRGAFPDPGRGFETRSILDLASSEDVESRFVRRVGADWRLAHGPVPRGLLARAGRRNWTLLVQGVNLHLAAADRLLRRFDFLPQARLDDVMVSIAASGGGVGPHYDSYDVFLIQVAGRRVWRICRPRSFAAVEGSELRLIANFVAEEEYLVEPGDLLYLPPGWGHDGVALEESLACSVGMRAPRGAELGAALLDFLHERGIKEQAYRDPGLRPAAHPGLIPPAMQTFAQQTLARVRWTRRDVADVLGRQLTTPKAEVVFAPPRRPLGHAAFAARLAVSDAALDPKTMLLYDSARFFLNGEALAPPAAGRAALMRLADRRRIPGRHIARGALAAYAYDWYLNGFLHLEAAQ